MFEFNLIIGQCRRFYLNTKIFVGQYTIHTASKCACHGTAPNSNIWAGKKQSCAEVCFTLPRKKYTLLIYFLFCTFLFGKWDVLHPQVPSELQFSTPTMEMVLTMVRFHCVYSNDGSTATNKGCSTVKWQSKHGVFVCVIDFLTLLMFIPTNWTELWRRV